MTDLLTDWYNKHWGNHTPDAVKNHYLYWHAFERYEQTMEHFK
jgi:hypothetical protein